MRVEHGHALLSSSLMGASCIVKLLLPISMFITKGSHCTVMQVEEGYECSGLQPSTCWPAGDSTASAQSGMQKPFSLFCMHARSDDLACCMHILCAAVQLYALCQLGQRKTACNQMLRLASPGTAMLTLACLHLCSFELLWLTAGAIHATLKPTSSQVLWISHIYHFVAGFGFGCTSCQVHADLALRPLPSSHASLECGPQVSNISHYCRCSMSLGCFSSFSLSIAKMFTTGYDCLIGQCVCLCR